MKTNKPVLLLITIILAALSSCSNLFDPLSVNRQYKSGEQTYITISEGGNGKSRSVLPSIKTENCTFLELTGRNRNDAEEYKVLGTWDSYGEMLGSKIPVTLGTWDFSLNARCGGTELSCDREGYEVRLGTNTINFELQVTSYSTAGFGNLSITVSFPASPDADVKAQLLETGTLAPLTDEELLTVSHGANLNTVTYIKNQLAAGSYVVKLNFYSKQGLKLNSYSEIAVIAGDLDTSANRCLSSLNDIYTVKYVLNGGFFADGITVPTSFTRKSSIILPDEESVLRSNYFFAGWYDNPSFQNSPVKSIKKGTAGSVTLYAKWTDSANQIADGGSVNSDTHARISCPDTLEMTLADKSRKITATLLNGSNASSGGFTFALDREGIASIDAQSSNGNVFISPVKKGFAELTVTHTGTGATKNVLIFVAEDSSSLANSSAVYMTASDNVAVLNSLNSQKTIRLNAKNMSDYEKGNIEWSSSSPAIVRVIGNGASATIISLAYGQAEVTACHPDSLNELVFHVFVNDRTVTVTEQENSGSGSGSSGEGGTTYPDGVVSMTPYYLISSLPSGVTTSSDGWSENPSQPTEDLKYLWSFTRIIYADGTYTDTVPCVIGTYGTGTAHGTDGTAGQDGQNGLNGVNGAGIASMKAYYLISSSMNNITRQTEGWSETPAVPTESLKYLWSYTRVIYTDGTYTDTEPCIIGTWSPDGTSGNTGSGAQGSSQTKYLTASKSYWSIQQGNVITVTVSSAGISAYDYASIEWTADDTDILQILSSNGLSATIKGKAAGIASLKAEYPASGSSVSLTIDVAAIPDRNIYISTSSEVMQLTKDSQTTLLQAVLVNSQKSEPKGFSFEIDDTSVAVITAQTESGYCYVKPVAPGQAQVTVSNDDAEHPKKVLVTVGNSEEELAGMVYLTTSSNVVSVSEGNTKTVSVSVKNSNDVVLNGYSWSSSDPAVVSVTGNGATAVLNGNSIGSAIITCTQTSCTYPLTIIAQCVDPRAAQMSPYIQLSSNVLNLEADGTYTNITADLVGGSDGDKSGFAWASNDSTICSVFGQNETGKLKALAAGTTYITVSHPKASYSAQILVICDEPVKNDCYISVPSSILSMKPTDGQKTISATLINGTQTDRYNFSWSLDVYDVIDFQYAANVCTITPKQAGSVTITVSHPKAAYDQQIIVNVQQYSTFAFPGDYVNITEGTVQFLNMEVPVTNMSTYVRYYIKNDGDENIVSISGTKNVAQLTGVGSGTCTVYADLIATSTGTVQATDDLLVYVKPAPANSVYITSANTINTIQRGKSQTISAFVTGTGITQDDQYKLKWSTTDTDVINIGGLGSDGTVMGSSIYVTAKKEISAEAHEAVITCTHEKAPSALQFYVFVPGSESMYISMNKTMLSLVKGQSGTTLSATIDNAQSREDYNRLEWTAEPSENGDEIVRVIGSGQTVNIYPVGAGECKVKCTLEGAKNEGVCTVMVAAPKSFLFDDSGTTLKVEPDGGEKTRAFTVSPPDAQLTFTAMQDGEYFTYEVSREVDDKGRYTGRGTVKITGIQDGQGTLSCVTDGNAKGQLRISVGYDTSFDVQIPSSVTIEPVSPGTVGRSFSYSMLPTNAPSGRFEVHAETAASAGYEMCEVLPGENGMGVININPRKESASPVQVVMYLYDKVKHENIGQRTIQVRAEYASVTPSVTFKDKDGRFSSLKSGGAYVGDGETLRLQLAVNEPNANVKFSNVAFVKNTAATTAYGNVSLEYAAASGTVTLKSDTDYKKMGYRINKAYCPVYKDGTVCKDLSRIVWVYKYRNDSGTWSERAKIMGLAHLSISKHITTGSGGLYSITDDPWKIIKDQGAYVQTGVDSEGNPIQTWVTNATNPDYLRLIDWVWTEHSDFLFGGASHGYFRSEQGNIGSEDDTNWVLQEFPEEVGKFYYEDAFKKIAWYWCPKTFRIYKNEKHDESEAGSGSIIFSEGIMTNHVNASYVTTSDTTEVTCFRIGEIQYTLEHNGTVQKPNGGNYYTVNVYLSVTPCAAK